MTKAPEPPGHAAGPTPPTVDFPPETLPDGPLFAAAAPFALRYYEVWQAWRRVKCVLQQPKGPGRVDAWRRALPELAATVPEGPTTHDLLTCLDRSRRLPWLRPGAGVSVLPLPASLADYRRGRSRQALRTNVTRATKDGLQVSDVPVERRRVVSAELAQHRATEGLAWMDTDWHLQLSTDRWFAVRDDAGGILALGSLLVAGEVAWIVFKVARKEDPRSSGARYLLHQHLVAAAIDAGARLLATDCPLTEPGGIHHYQRLVGFGYANLALAHPDGTAVPLRDASMPRTRLLRSGLSLPLRRPLTSRPSAP